MPTIIVKTQAEIDALPASFSEFTVIEIHGGTSYDRLIVKTKPVNGHVVARGSSHVVARGSSHVVARESSHVEAWGSSHVVARESSHVVARGSSHVEAWEYSHVVAWGSSHVVARESSYVEAWEYSHVVAQESSHVVAQESSHVVAWGSSHVEAWESSHVEAWGSCAVHNYSVNVTLELFAFSAAWLIAKAKTLNRHGNNTTIIVPETVTTLDGWLEAEALKATDGKVTVFKRVSNDWKTQEGTANETLWAPGTELSHPSYNPTEKECGADKYHACSHAYFCDEFRSTLGDHYIAIEVKVNDMYVWPDAQYPHKVAFRAGKVLFECDRYGKKLTS